jgi:hypothetical protein
MLFRPMICAFSLWCDNIYYQATSVIFIILLFSNITLLCCHWSTSCCQFLVKHTIIYMFRIVRSLSGNLATILPDNKYSTFLQDSASACFMCWNGTINKLALCTRPTLLSWIFIVLAHWNNSPRIDMLPHSDTLSWFRMNQSLLFLLNVLTMT